MNSALWIFDYKAVVEGGCCPIMATPFYLDCLLSRPRGQPILRGLSQIRAALPYGHLASGGRLMRIASTLPPVLRPKVVPRSYTRLNSA